MILDRCLPRQHFARGAKLTLGIRKPALFEVDPTQGISEASVVRLLLGCTLRKAEGLIPGRRIIRKEPRKVVERRGTVGIEFQGFPVGPNGGLTLSLQSIRGITSPIRAGVNRCSELTSEWTDQ